MKLQGIYRGKLTIIDLPVTDYQWAAYNTGRSSLERCFPHLNSDELSFIQSASKIETSKKTAEKDQAPGKKNTSS